MNQHGSSEAWPEAGYHKELSDNPKNKADRIRTIKEVVSVKTKEKRTPSFLNGHQWVSIGFTLHKEGTFKELAIIPMSAHFNTLPELRHLILEVTAPGLVLSNGHNPEEGYEFLWSWYQDLNLPNDKLLCPIVWNLPHFEKIFEATFGEDTYEDIFSRTYMFDTHQASIMVNTVNLANGEETMFPKTTDIMSAYKRSIGSFDKECDSGFYRAALGMSFFEGIIKHNFRLNRSIRF